MTGIGFFTDWQDVHHAAVDVDEFKKVRDLRQQVGWGSYSSEVNQSVVLFELQQPSWMDFRDIHLYATMQGPYNSWQQVLQPELPFEAIPSPPQVILSANAVAFYQQQSAYTRALIGSAINQLRQNPTSGATVLPLGKAAGDPVLRRAKRSGYYIVYVAYPQDQMINVLHIRSVRCLRY